MTKLRDYRVRHRQLLSHFDRVSEGASERRSRTVMVWPERGAGLSPLVAGCDHWTYLSNGLRRRRHGVRPNAGGRCTIYYATAMRVFANRSFRLFKRGEEGANVAQG